MTTELKSFTVRWLASTCCLLLTTAGCSSGDSSDDESCKGDRVATALEIAVHGIVPLDDPTVGAVVNEVAAYNDHQPPPRDGRRPCEGDNTAEFGYLVIMSTLVANPELASPEMIEGMVNAAGGGNGVGGAEGVYDFVTDTALSSTDYPELAELQDRLGNAEDTMHARAVILEDEGLEAD